MFAQGLLEHAQDVTDLFHGNIGFCHGSGCRLLRDLSSLTVGRSWYSIRQAILSCLSRR
jgi:hypothetical protein